MTIIFDYNRTLFNPDTDLLYQGVLELLEHLSFRHELFLVSRNEPGRREKLKNFGISKYFKDIVFVSAKTASVFENLTSDHERTIIIGDRVREEIAVGNKLRYITIWVRQGKFANEIPAIVTEKPTHTAEDIQEVHKIITTYEK